MDPTFIDLGGAMLEFTFRPTKIQPDRKSYESKSAEAKIEEIQAGDLKAAQGISRLSKESNKQDLLIKSQQGEVEKMRETVKNPDSLLIVSNEKVLKSMLAVEERHLAMLKENQESMRSNSSHIENSRTGRSEVPLDVVLGKL